MCSYDICIYVYEILHHFFVVTPNITNIVCSEPVISGSTVVCHCNVTANPGANISWLQNEASVKGPHFIVTDLKSCDDN